MGVGVQGESGREVPQHTGHRLDVYAVLQGDGCEGVAEVVESDLRDDSPLNYSLKHVIHTVWRDWATIGRGEHIRVIGLSLLLP